MACRLYEVSLLDTDFPDVFFCSPVSFAVRRIIHPLGMPRLIGHQMCQYIQQRKITSWNLRVRAIVYKWALTNDNNICSISQYQK